ncbi:MAG: hypothetical protein ABL888_06075 [Pirellulaceae bacterium]
MSSTQSTVSSKIRLVWGLTFLVLIGIAAIRIWNPAPDRLLDYGQRRTAVTNDNLAFQLSRGRLFSVDFDDPEWKQDRNITAEEFETLDNWAVFTRGPTTRSPPLFPLVQTLGQTAGRWRNHATLTFQTMFNAAALATLLVFATKHLETRWLIPLALFLLAFDQSLFWNSHRFVVNELSVGLVAMLVVSASSATVRGTVGAWATLGFWLALQVLNEGQSLIWLGWGLLIWPIMLASWGISGRSIPKFLWPSLAMATVILLVCGPWWVRNAQLTNLGGAWGYDLPIQLTGGYFDDVIVNRGQIAYGPIRIVESSISSGKRYRELDQPHRERAMADLAFKHTFGWLGRNLSQVPPLIQWKVLNHLNLTKSPIQVGANGLLLVLAFLGCWMSRVPLGFWIAALILISVLTNAVTWSDGGYSSIPLRPLIAIAASYAIIFTLRNGWNWLRRKSIASLKT